MSILVRGDDIRSGTKANACHGWLRAAQESMGLKGACKFQVQPSHSYTANVCHFDIWNLKRKETTKVWRSYYQKQT